MEITLGIDLASQPKQTAVCVIAWGRGAAEVRALARGSWDGHRLDDALLSRAIRGDGPIGRPVKTAIDAPFGWPEPFVRALEVHHRLAPWPGELGEPRVRFERRTTDLFVHERTKKLPLSVSTDRIAYCAMRCAGILADVGRHLGPDQVARNGAGLVVEAYPDAALRCWLPEVWTRAREDSYKGDGAPAHARRERIVAAVRALMPTLSITPQQREDCVRSDDCLDALVCALLARAAARSETIVPEEAEHQRLARSEGWIHLPCTGSLERLA